MKLLILGGTRFLGRHLVDLALERRHDVTIFTRGRTPVPWRERVVALTGDRDPKVAPGLAALDGASFDAVVDCSGYVPRVVDASARLIAERARRYLFVSSVSVYADVSRPGVDESGAAAIPAVIFPMTKPGLTRSTRTPVQASASVRPRAKASSPALAAP